MNTIIEALGWTLIHFLWQGSLIAVVLWGALRILRTAPTQWRYSAAGCAMLIMLASAVSTGSREWQLAATPIAPVPLEILVPLTRDRAAPQAPEGSSNPQPSLIAEDSSRPSIVEVPAVESQVFDPLTRAQQTLHSSLPWIVALWVTGVSVLSLVLLRRWLALRRIRLGARDPVSIALLSRLLKKLHVRQPVTLLITSEAVVPMVVAWLRPIIIVPASFFTRLPYWQVEAILAHELGHIRRQDYLVNLLQNFVELVFFYHPAVWWVSAQLRKEREHCCDDTAAAACGGALEYAKALTALEEMRGYAPAGAMSASGSSLLARVQRLLGVEPRKPCTVFFWPIGVAITLLVACLVIGVHFARGASENVDLSDIPHVGDVTRITELYEPDPDRLGEFRKKPDVFFMRLGEVNVGPWLYYAANSERFYLSFRKDPEVIEDATYGPIPGDPVDKLDLNQWLHDQRESMDPDYALRVLRDMIQFTDESLNRAAFAYMRELEAPEERDDYDHLIEVTQRALKERPVSSTAAEAATALAHVEDLTDTAKEAWESSRKPLPESQYASGTPIAEEDASIIWAEPNDVGLRLGISGVAPGAEWTFGSVIRFQIYVRNDGSDPVKFSWTGRQDDGFRATLRGENGTSVSADIVRWSALLIPMRTRLSPDEMLLIKTVDLQIDTPNADGSAPDRQGSEDRFVVDPGAYKFEAELPFSSFQFIAPAGEWIGRLTTKPIGLTIADKG